MGSIRPRSFVECVQILWRRKSLIAFIGLIVLLAATAVIMGIPKVYESRSLIVVSGAIYDRQANGAQVAAVTEQITSRSNLEALLARYNLQGGANLESAIQQLQKEIKFETKFRSDSQGFPESFTISYRHANPVIARNVVTDLVSVFDEANDTLEKQAAEEARRIKAEIAEIESKLGHATAQRLASAARSTAASRAASAIERQRAEQNAIASSLETLRDRQFALETQIAEQKKLISQQQEILKASPPPIDDTRAANSYGALLKRKADLEAQIQEYSSNFTDKYPKLVQAREQLAEVNQRLAGLATSGEQARASASSPAALELRNLQRELSRMQTDLEIVRREIDRKQQTASRIPSGGAAPAYVPAPLPPATYAGTTGLGADYGSEGLRERYTALIRREEAIRPFQPSTTGPGTRFFQMVDQPSLPQAPAAPIRSRLMLIACLLALVTGVIGAAVVEARKLSLIHDERDVNYFLGVPVVAVIPETLTTTERGRGSQRMFARRLGYLVLGAAAVPLLALLLNFTKLFQVLGSK